MRTDCTIDDKRVLCPNASLLAYGTRVLKAGMCFLYQHPNTGIHLARSLGHIVSTNNDGDAFDGICAMVLANAADSAYERWINPADVIQIFEAPTKFAAFFFAPSLPYDANGMRRLMEYGTISERYLHNLESSAEKVRAKPQSTATRQSLEARHAAFW